MGQCGEVRSEGAGPPGVGDVFGDPRTGAALARRDRLHFADGTLRFDVGQRQPTHDRIAAPAALLDLTVDGVPSTTTSDGTVTSPGTEPAAVAFGMTGTLVRVLNEAGAGATATLSMVSGGTITFGNATDELIDAQASTYVYVNQVKAFWRAHIDPGFAYLDQLLTSHVNEAGDCNAFSDGDDIHFFPRTAECENTGRLADVVYHEFGHSLHAPALANGPDQFDPGPTEGPAG